VETVYHLAGVTKAKTAEAYFTGNFQGTVNLLDVCDRHGPAEQKFVFVSSQAAGGPSAPGSAKTEESGSDPISVYGKSKLRAEEAVLKYGFSHPVTIIRPPSVYGPRDRDIYVLFRNVARGFLPLLGDGRQKASVVYISDLIDGILLAGRSRAADGRLYYISGDGEYDWITIGETIAREMGKKPLKLFIPFWLLDVLSVLSSGWAKISKKPALLNRDKASEMKQASWLCSNQRAKNELSYEPKVDFSNGVRLTVEWYREQGWL
jgi:nucleoside-diphosphate-sugar epimerase